MMKTTAIIGTLLVSLSAGASPVDLNVFSTLTAVGVATDLSASSRTKVISIGSIECRADTKECLIDDQSNHGFQRTITGDNAKTVSDLLSSAFHAQPVFEESGLLRVSDLHCAQSEKDGAPVEQQTACYAQVETSKSTLRYWGDMLGFQRVISEK